MGKSKRCKECGRLINFPDGRDYCVPCQKMVNKKPKLENDSKQEPQEKKTLDSYTVRLATENDIDELVELSQLWVKKDKKLKRQMLKSCINLSTYRMVVLEHGGKIIGWLSTYLRMSWVNVERRLFISSVFTHPDYRMMGVMKILWEKIEATCDYDVVFVDTNLDYPLHLGFERSGCTTFIKRKDNSKCSCNT